MPNTHWSDISGRVSECIQHLKTSSNVLEMSDIMRNLQDRYPNDAMFLKDLSPLIFNAANAHQVALNLDGSGHAPQPAAE